MSIYTDVSDDPFKRKYPSILDQLHLARQQASFWRLCYIITVPGLIIGFVVVTTH